MASEKLILDSLKKMKDGGLKKVPENIGADLLEFWAETFSSISDDMFSQLVREYARSEEYFPAPGSLYKMVERRLDTTIELAWQRVLQLAKMGIRRVETRERTREELEAMSPSELLLNGREVHTLITGFTLEHINDPYALWAISQMENVDTLGHREQPFKFAETKRAEFGRLYRAAWQHGYRLDRWHGKPQALHQNHQEQLAASNQRSSTPTMLKSLV